MDTTLETFLRTPIEPRSDRAATAAAPLAGATARQSADDARLGVASASAGGSLHAVNEDAVSALAGGGSLFVVADGVGGGAMARLASRLLVRVLHDVLVADGAPPPTPDAVRRAVLEADRSIAARIARVTDEPGAATLVLAAPLDDAATRWLVAWVGDCRAYRLARGRPGDRAGTAARVELLTRDDTFRHLREPVPRGSGPDDPARMVGNGATDGANVAVHDLGPGELLALCSDGVHRHLAVGDWRRVLAQRVPLADRCEDAIRIARSNGSVDDATVLLIERPPLATAEDATDTPTSATTADGRPPTGVRHRLLHALRALRKGDAAPNRNGGAR